MATLLSKSSIPTLFKRYCPDLDPKPFLAAAQVFPMRVNSHVVDNLIDWSAVPNDPIFRLAFPHPDMLSKEDMSAISRMLSRNASRVQLQFFAEGIRQRLNPHPSGQKEENVPWLNGVPVPGMQHKYRETVLFFPAEGQFCHAYCTYCFRWAQFSSVGSEQPFKSRSRTLLADYVRLHPDVTDVLFTGGDPMVMPTRILAEYITPLLPRSGGPSNLATIRIGTKSLAWWPDRFLGAGDAKQLLELFTETVASGLHLTIQAHFSHPRELLDPKTRAAIRAVRSTGAIIRCQAPLMYVSLPSSTHIDHLSGPLLGHCTNTNRRHINDSASTWANMWRLQISLGMIPYYMFVERDTGAAHYFSVPLATAIDIFALAYSMAPGTARTVRGPSMSTGPGKVCVLGTETVAQQQVFVLKFIQAREPRWCHRIFFAEYDPEAVWFQQLRPAFGEDQFFFEQEYADMRANTANASSGQVVAPWRDAFGAADVCT